MGTSCSGGQGCDRGGQGGQVPQEQRGEGLAECTSAAARKAPCPHPMAASPCPISAIARLAFSSSQPCSAQDQLLLIWASQQSHECGASRTTQLPTAQELPQGSCQLPWPAQLLSPPSTQLSLVSWALTVKPEGSSRPQGSHHQESALLQQPLLLCAQPSPDLEEMAAPQTQFEEIARA